MNRFHEHMNPEQVRVIDHDKGPLRVFAVAGSGKTRALVHRIANLVENGVDPRRILAVTFSKDAATEMKERAAALGVSSESIQTWHSLCLRIIKEDATEWSRWEIDSKSRAKFFLKEAIGFKHMKWTPRDFGTLSRFIGLSKAHLLTPEDAECHDLARKMMRHEASNAVRAYALFQELIEQAGILTFDDMLVFTHRHLQDEFTQQSWASRWDYVMQDEAQDASPAQCAIAELLARDHGNYMVVGDLAQSIYGFRGSDPTILAKFPEEWPGCTSVAMFRNYRSARSIVAFANDVIAPAEVRMNEEMVAERDLDGVVRVVGAETLDDEAQAFVEHVRGGIADGERPESYACIFRTNAQSRALEDRLLNTPFRFLGARFVERVMDLAGSEQPMEGSPDWRAIIRTAASQAGIQARQVASAEQWCALIGDIQKMIDDDQPPSAMLRHVVRVTRFIEYLDAEEGEESIESSHGANVRELQRITEKFATAEEFLDYVANNIADAARQRRGTRSRVLLMSIHKSKGLEWPHVWVVGCNEKVLPHAKGDPEEERRLMYVAATRARDTLTLSHVRHFSTRNGPNDESHPSIFIESLLDDSDDFVSAALPDLDALA